MNDEKCASFACTLRSALSARARDTVNRSSAGAFISTVAPRVGHDDRVGDRVDDQVEAIAFRAGGRFGTRSLW